MDLLTFTLLLLLALAAGVFLYSYRKAKAAEKAHDARAEAFRLSLLEKPKDDREE